MMCETKYDCTGGSNALAHKKHAVVYTQALKIRPDPLLFHDGPQTINKVFALSSRLDRRWWIWHCAANERPNGFACENRDLAI